MQAIRFANDTHSSKMETYAWNQLKVSYAFVTGSKRALIITAFFAPFIFTSVSTFGDIILN
jgi:hypothetical protein